MRLGDLAPDLRKYVRPCWPKEQQPSQGKAEAQLRSLVNRERRKNASAHVYYCPHCGYWHVGHSERRDS